MGTFINTGNEAFRSVLNGEYADKSRLIAIVNNSLFSERRFSCVSRSRRFGKSLAAQLLVGINYNRKTKRHDCHIEKLTQQ